MDNATMKPGRFLRWALARRKLNWIVARVNEGRDVFLTTATRSTRIGKRQLAQVRATKNGLSVQHGSKWLNHDYSKITAGEA